MKKTHLLAILFGTAVAMPSFAGDVSIAPPPPPVEESSSIFSGSVTLGFDSDYVYRGFEIYGPNGKKARRLVHSALDLNVALTDSLSWDLGAWYASSSVGDYDELNLATKFNYSVGPVTISPSFRWYNYPDFSSPVDNQYEVGLEVSVTPVEGLSLTLGGFYEFEAEQWLFTFDANYTIKIGERFALVPGATISYIDVHDQTWGLDFDGFHHVSAYLKAPISLFKNVTLTPYIAANFPISNELDAIQDNIVYGGATFSVSF